VAKHQLGKQKQSVIQRVIQRVIQQNSSAQCVSESLATPQAVVQSADWLCKEMLCQQPEQTIYTCPMHPEINQDRSGACLICGMVLDQNLLAIPNRKTIRN